jgi:hypothetical protein
MSDQSLQCAKHPINAYRWLSFGSRQDWAFRRSPETLQTRTRRWRCLPGHPTFLLLAMSHATRRRSGSARAFLCCTAAERGLVLGLNPPQGSHREARLLSASAFFRIGGTGKSARGLCIRKNRKDANEDFTAGGSLPRSGSGVFESCHHHADAADARSIQRHGPPLSYSGRDPWKESASRPPKGAFEGAEVQVWEEALHSRITGGWSKCAAGTDVHETEASCEAGRIGVETLDTKIGWRYEQTAGAQTALADLKEDHKPITRAMPVP